MVLRSDRCTRTESFVICLSADCRPTCKIYITTSAQLSLNPVELSLADRRSAGRRVGASSPTNTSDPYRNFKSPCGSALQVSERVGRCLEPIFELIEGRSQLDPKSDQDLMVCCDRFANTEKCVRNIAKDCLTGIAKTSTSTVSSGYWKIDDT